MARWAAPFVVSSRARGRPPRCSRVPRRSSPGTPPRASTIFNGLVNHSPTPDQNLQPQLGGCCGYVPKMALDSAGHIWIAWYSNATGSTGEYVQQLDPATAAPIGPPVLGPNSESSNNNSFGTALACAATCRVVYGNSPAASTTDLIVSWWPGQAAPTTIADLAGTGQGAGRVLTAAYRADGRLWVAWFDGKTYRATLGDGDGRRRRAAGCRRAQGRSRAGAYGLVEHRRRRQPAAGSELRLARDRELPFAVFVNTIAPPAPVTTAPGPRDVTLAEDAGRQGLPHPGAVHAAEGLHRQTPCTLRGELRTRTGRRLYAVAPLPGDTKLVLGTRARLAVPKGARARSASTSRSARRSC